MSKKRKPFKTRRRRYGPYRHEARVKISLSRGVRLHKELIEKELLGERIKNPLTASKVSVEEIKPFLTRTGQILPKRINDLLGKLKSKTQKRIAKMIKRQRNESNLDRTLTIVPNSRFPHWIVPYVPYKLRPENQPGARPPRCVRTAAVRLVLKALFSYSEVKWIYEILNASRLVLDLLFEESKKKSTEYLSSQYIEVDYDFADLILRDKKYLREFKEEKIKYVRRRLLNKFFIQTCLALHQKRKRIRRSSKQPVLARQSPGWNPVVDPRLVQRMKLKLKSRRRMKSKKKSRRG